MGMEERVNVAALAAKLEDTVRTAFVGEARPVHLAVLGLLSGLHVLVEDVPGVGKTTLALALAKAAGLSFSRIQFTADLVPGDVLGMNTWDAGLREFVFRPGPIHASFILADEINRASPRTQSAFLEAMQEGRVTVDGRTASLPSPFFLMATENPQNFIGTFPLPEAELDRFGLSFSIGYPAQEAEEELLERWTAEGTAEGIGAVSCPGEIAAARAAVAGIGVSAVLRSYLVTLLRVSRTLPELRLGAGPRGGAFLQQAARARAAIAGRLFVIPEDVEAIAVPVLAHRFVLSSQARLSGLDGVALVKKVLASVPKPTGL